MITLVKENVNGELLLMRFWKPQMSSFEFEMEWDDGTDSDYREEKVGSASLRQDPLQKPGTVHYLGAHQCGEDR